jgi:hypothetical protein
VGRVNDIRVFHSLLQTVVPFNDGERAAIVENAHVQQDTFVRFMNEAFVPSRDALFRMCAMLNQGFGASFEKELFLFKQGNTTTPNSHSAIVKLVAMARDMTQTLANVYNLITSFGTYRLSMSGRHFGIVKDIINGIQRDMQCQISLMKDAKKNVVNNMNKAESRARQNWLNGADERQEQTAQGYMARLQEYVRQDADGTAPLTDSFRVFEGDATMLRGVDANGNVVDRLTSYRGVFHTGPTVAPNGRGRNRLIKELNTTSPLLSQLTAYSRTYLNNASVPFINKHFYMVQLHESKAFVIDMGEAVTRHEILTLTRYALRPRPHAAVRCTADLLPRYRFMQTAFQRLPEDYLLEQPLNVVFWMDAAKVERD